MPKKKKSYAQDNIYVVRQFAYVYGAAEISLLSEKNTKSSSTIFLSLKNQQQETLITKTAFFIFYAQDSQWTTKRAKIFFQLGPIHGLSLRKSLIKNHATIFWVGSGRQPD